MNGKVIKEAYTFDDLLLVPGKSVIVPAQVDVRTRLTEKIRLNIPIVSAAMDTVTEDRMAIALSTLGGLGFIHKNMPAEVQAQMVQNVKDRAKHELTGRAFINKFRVSANYTETFPKGVENIKATGWIGHETAEEWLSKKDGIYYIHQPVCKANGWYAIPESEFTKFQNEFKKSMNKDI